MTKPIFQSVVVITGASSGIGRATALELARRRAGLVLAARSDEPLEDVVEECRSLGARAVAASTDVTDAADVEALARRAIETFGRVDVWINDAGVGIYSRFEDAPLETHRRIIETNLLGPIQCVYAVLPLLKRQRSGHIINVSSLLGAAAFPYASTYVASKFGLRGLSESLRSELRGTGVEVSTIFPASTDTPFFRHAANYTGRGIKPAGAVYAPEQVARAIVSCIRRPRAEVFVGRTQYVLRGLRAAFLGRGYERFTKELTDKEHFLDKKWPKTSGVAFQASQRDVAVRGGWNAKDEGEPSGAGFATGLAALAAGTALAAWAFSRRRASRTYARYGEPSRQPAASAAGAPERDIGG